MRLPGIPNARVSGYEFRPIFQKDMVEFVRQEEKSGLLREGDIVNLLAISGGGGDGAFGAGLLCGWTAAGDRLSFKMVTGISTGALTEPFAFLGPVYDEMPVDGGVANPVFLYGPRLDVAQAMDELGTERPRRKFREFVIRNTRIKPRWQDRTPLIRKIAPRSISSLIRSQRVDDLCRIYVTSLRDGLYSTLAYIPDFPDTNRTDEFDTGCNLARNGYRWFKAPPGFFPSQPRGGDNRPPVRRKRHQPAGVSAPCPQPTAQARAGARD